MDTCCSTSGQLIVCLSVDRNLLRISLYEILKVPEVDVAVAINKIITLPHPCMVTVLPRLLDGIIGRIVDDIDAGEDIYSLCHKQSVEEVVLQKSQWALWKM